MKTTAIIIRNVPESVHQAIKIAAIREGKTMQALILELIVKHTKGGGHE